MIRKTVWVDPELWGQARVAALTNNEPFHELLRRALKREVEKVGLTPKKQT